ncbi:unnamed protein product, partial [Cladocopium goreaui]
DQVNENLKSNSEEEKSEEKEDLGDDSSEESGFDLKNKAKKKAPTKRFRGKQAETEAPAAKATRKAEKEKEKEKEKTETEASAAPSSKSSGSGKVNPEKVMAGAKQSLAALQQVSPMMLWGNRQKVKETDSKVVKAMDLVTKLEGIKSEEAAKLMEEISSMADRMSKWVEIVNQISIVNNESPQEVVEKLTAQSNALASALQTQSADCMRQALVDIGKMLLEAFVSMLAVDPGVTAEHRGSFFEYISIRKEAKERAMFTLAKMMEHSKLGTEGMIAIQCSLFSAWVDKLRTINTETTVAVLNSIPDFCNCPDVL